MKKTFLTIIIAILSIVLISCNKNKDPELKGKITLSHKELTINANASSSSLLTATLIDIEGELVWSSTDNEIATVTVDKSDSKIARVTGLNPGVVLIRASIGEVYGEVRVIVNQGDFLTLKKDRFDLAIGQTDVIVYESHTTNVTFTSSNKNIATVNSEGLISAIGIGNTTITVKTRTKTAYVTVFVAKAEIVFKDDDDVVLHIVDNKTESILVEGRGGVNPSSGVWSVDDEGVFEYLINGNEITITALDTGIGKTTFIRFNLEGFDELVKRVVVKDRDLELKVSPSYVVISFKEDSIQLEVTINPELEEGSYEVIYEVDIEGVVVISDDGLVTRNPDYVFLDDEITITITVKSVIDPDAYDKAVIIVESPMKGTKYIYNNDDFDKAMAHRNSDGTNDADIYLMTDIDLDGKVYSNNIMGADFSGHFHGNGYSIKNFKAEGLVNFLYGTIENLEIKGIMSGSQRGFIAFHIAPEGVLRNMIITVTFEKPSIYISGIALLGNAENVILYINNIGIQQDQAYADFVQTGTSKNVYYNLLGSSVGKIGSGTTSKTIEQLKQSSLYSSFDKTIWNITDGELPSLNKLSNEVEEE